MADGFRGVTNLFENLASGTYMNLFMGLVLARVIVWLGLATVDKYP